MYFGKKTFSDYSQHYSYGNVYVETRIMFVFHEEREQSSDLSTEIDSKWNRKGDKPTMDMKLDAKLNTTFQNLCIRPVGMWKTRVN